MKVAKFDPDGGPITVRVECGFAQPGAYEIFLWEADRNSRRSLGVGNFISSEDDTYHLPSGSGNDGRILQCIATVNPVESGDRFGVSLVVEQDGKELVRELVDGSSDLPTVTVALYVRLQGVTG